jgi:anti-sigma factor RsiW
MNKDDQDRIKKLLQQAMPPVKGESEPRRDLWPAMLRRLNARPAAPAQIGWAWFDGALAFGLLGLAAFFPASIPLLLYYL